MSWKWAGRTAAVAVATAALALAAGMPLVGIAEAPKVEEVKVAQATQDSCAVELFAGKAGYTAGEKPVLFLKIANNSGDSAEIEATVTIQGTTPVSEFSRMMPRVLGVLWKHTGTFLVLPGETQRFDLPVDITTPEKQSLRFTLQLGTQPAEGVNVNAPGVSKPAMPRLVERAVRPEPAERVPSALSPSKGRLGTAGATTAMR